MNPLHERLLERAYYSCSEPECVRSRQKGLRDLVNRAVESSGDNGRELRESCRAAIISGRPDLLLGAIAYLFVIGDIDDVELLDDLRGHSNPEIAKAVRTCIFEIEHRRG